MYERIAGFRMATRVEQFPQILLRRKTQKYFDLKHWQIIRENLRGRNLRKSAGKIQVVLHAWSASRRFPQILLRRKTQKYFDLKHLQIICENLRGRNLRKSAGKIQVAFGF